MCIFILCIFYNISLKPENTKSSDNQPSKCILGWYTCPMFVHIMTLPKYNKNCSNQQNKHCRKSTEYTVIAFRNQLDSNFLIKSVAWWNLSFNKEIHTEIYCKQCQNWKPQWSTESTFAMKIFLNCFPEVFFSKTYFYDPFESYNNTVLCLEIPAWSLRFKPDMKKLLINWVTQCFATEQKQLLSPESNPNQNRSPNNSFWCTQAPTTINHIHLYGCFPSHSILRAQLHPSNYITLLLNYSV